MFADHMQPSILWVREHLAALVGWQETFKLLGPQVSGIPDAERRDAQSFRHSSAVPSQADHAFLYNAARWGVSGSHGNKTAAYEVKQPLFGKDF